MKLYMVGASPYARKVRAVAVSLGLAERLELVIANPHERPEPLVALNPLSRVPTLLTDDGETVIDSLNICEYLAALVPGQSVIDFRPGPSRRKMLHRHALAHGVMECGVILRVESLKAVESDRTEWMQRQQTTIARVLDVFETDPVLEGPMTLDRLTLACALGFLDFRFPEEGWRIGRPRLAGWQARAETLPALSETRPFA